jgi:hypothetical protein
VDHVGSARQSANAWVDCHMSWVVRAEYRLSWPNDVDLPFSSQDRVGHASGGQRSPLDALPRSTRVRRPAWPIRCLAASCGLRSGTPEACPNADVLNIRTCGHFGPSIRGRSRTGTRSASGHRYLYDANIRVALLQSRPRFCEFFRRLCLTPTPRTSLATCLSPPTSDLLPSNIVLSQLI